MIYGSLKLFLLVHTFLVFFVDRHFLEKNIKAYRKHIFCLINDDVFRLESLFLYISKLIHFIFNVLIF